jgi:hypothetical protein
MTLQKLDPREAFLAMRAVKTVITADGPMRDSQRNAMEMAQRYFLHTQHDITALEPVAPDVLAREIASVDLRRQLIQIMCAYVLLGKEIRPEHVAAIKGYARAFDIDDPAVDHLRYVIEDRIRWLKLDFRRRSLMGDVVKQAYDSGGVKGVFDTVMQIAGHGEDAQLAARFDAFERLPEGTLGRGLWEFYQKNGFTLPGHKNGTALPLIVHDFMHVLAGYEADVMGEVRTLGFQTGFKREKPLMFVFLLLFQTQIGIEMAGLVKAGSTKDLFDQPAAIEELFKAYARGAQMNVDLMDGSWDYWAVVDRPIEELRARYGVPAA